MLIDYDLLPTILTWAAGFFFIYFLLYKKYIYSVLDPIFFYTWGTAFSSVLVVNVIQDQRYITHYFVCQAFLFLGFICVQKFSFAGEINKVSFHFYDRNQLFITVYILFSIYVIANLYIIYLMGATIFSDDPTARVTNFQNGFGVFRRINIGIGSFLAAGLTILYITKPNRKFLLLIIILSFFTALEGSKSSLLRIVVIVAALIYHPYFRTSKTVISNLKKYGPLSILAVSIVFFFVLAKESKNNDVFLSFIKRLLSGADSILYFYLPQNDYLLTAYKPGDYFLYLLNPILGAIHLVPYIEPFGTIIVENTQISYLKTDVYLAPNTPFYIEGQIFFGYYGAFVYSFIIGGIFSFIRKIYVTLSQGSYFLLALSCAVFFHSGNILIETIFFTETFIDTFMFAPTIYVAVCLITNQKIVLRKLKFKSLLK